HYYLGLALHKATAHEPKNAPRGVPIHHSLFDPLSHLPHAALNGGTTPLPQHTRNPRAPLRKKKKNKDPPKGQPRHPQSTEPQQGTRASHSVARQAQHRGSTPKTVQNIRPALTRGKSDQIESLAPPPVAASITSRRGLRGNISLLARLIILFLLFTSYHRFSRFDIPRRSLLSFRPARCESDKETTYKHCQISGPAFESCQRFQGRLRVTGIALTAAENSPRW
ncbi:hypothetical protein N5P37_002123, partial [Trichoderma harzianum]